MNNVFDLHRWGLLVLKHWSDNRNKYLLSMGAIAALLLMWYGFLLIIDKSDALEQSVQVVTYYVGLFLTGSLYASLLFSDLGNKPKGINFLSVPASHLEKMLVMVLYCVLIFFVCYTAVFYLVDIIMVKVNNAIGYIRWKEMNAGVLDVRPFEPEQVVNVFYNERIAHNAPFNVLLFVLSIFFAIQGAYALGSIYFPAYSFIKTTIVLVLIILFFVFFMAKVLANILPPGFFSDKLEVYRLRVHDTYSTSGEIIKMPSWLGPLVLGIFRYLLFPVFWVAAFFRLKEKEV